MDERIVAFRVGVVVISTVMIVIILMALFGDVGYLFRSRYVLHVPFPRAPGITTGAPVRKSGIRIGQVQDLRLLPDRRVLLTLEIEGYDIARHERCHLSTSNILGDAVLEFVSTQDPVAGEPLYQPGETIAEGTVQRNPMEMLTRFEDDLDEAFASFTTAGNSLGNAGQEVEQLAKRINNFLDEEGDQLGSLLAKTESAVEQFDKTMKTVNGLLSDEELNAELRKTLERLPELMDETSQTLATIRAAADSAKVNLDDLSEFTGYLGEEGPGLIDDFRATVADLSALLEQFTLVGEKLNSGEGTIGQLINNPELYHNVNNVVKRVEQATKRLQPILNDVRVFTHKIAVDPGRLGVRGALQRPSGVK